MSISSVNRVDRCGRVSAVTATAYVVENFIATPSIVWLRPDGETATTNNTLDLTESSNGEYVFKACVTVESVNISNLCSNISFDVQNTSE